MAVRLCPSLRYSTEMVTVNLQYGREKASFTIHKSTISHHSPFFLAAFNGAFQEGQTQQMTLTDVDPKIFTIYVDWLYSQHISPTFLSEKIFIQTQLLAHRFLSPRLCNEVLRAYNQLLKTPGVYPEMRYFNLAYENTVDGSPLRKYLASLAAGGRCSLGWKKKAHREVLEDILEWVKVNMRTWNGRSVRDYGEEELKMFFGGVGKTTKSIAREVGTVHGIPDRTAN
ncbi:hypothetical protein HYALB_00008060 [Hymenoscyphus albidus]|uniref:BTB domain-containing protein n=1 Tax=Hymenoscyphus albidus TaxID=595503 RepID=A0A9N9Q1U4_9HELO|nr:hypothetical protein HYALB_00008060 [Hymenoscyphus albidus]